MLVSVSMDTSTCAISALLTRTGVWTVKADNDLFSLEEYTAQLAAGCDVVPIYAASKPLKAEDFPPMVRGVVWSATQS